MNSNHRKDTSRLFTQPALSNSKPIMIRVIYSSEEGKQRQIALNTRINGDWERTMSPDSGADFFPYTHINSQLQVYPMHSSEFSRLPSIYKKKEADITFICDNESLHKLLDKNMTNWLPPESRLIAFGFNPNYSGTSLPADSPQRGITNCPFGISKSSLLHIITGIEPAPRARGAETSRSTSVSPAPTKKKNKQCAVM